jgi:hypothetical protein
MSVRKIIIIEGVTESGETFRPSDWAERMCGGFCEIHNRRIFYSPLLYPIMKNGNKSIILDPQLKESNSELYESIMEFAKTNKLKIYTEDVTQ